MRATHKGILDTIESSGDIDDATEESLKQAIEQFKGSVAY
jgi:hypothetical protein